MHVPSYSADTRAVRPRRRPRRQDRCPPSCTTRWSTSPTAPTSRAHCCSAGCRSASFRPLPRLPRRPPTRTRSASSRLLTVARRLGQPVGYEPEHGGDLVQNIVPTEAAHRPAGVDVVEGGADVPHRGRVPSASTPLPAAAVPARRPGGAHDAVVDLRGPAAATRPRSSTCCSSRASARRSTRATCTVATTCSATRWPSSAAIAVARRWCSTRT